MTDHITRIKDDPEHWHNRAEEARMVAETIADPTARKTMIEIARAYDLLVIKAGERRVLRNSIAQARQSIDEAKETIDRAERRLADNIFQTENVINLKIESGR